MKNLFKIGALVISLVCILAVSVSSAGKLPFTDVPEDAWYYSTVAEAYEAGIMKGQSDTLFAPVKTMTRSEFITLLSRLAGADTEGFAKNIAKFDDGDTSAWYAGAMGWGVERGLVTGFTDNTVRPMQTITRAELAVLINRYLNYMGYTLPVTAEEGTFTDSDKILEWCAADIEACRRTGIFAGDDAGRFNPAKEATRAEGATIALRLTKSVDELLKTKGVVIGRDGEESPFTILYVFGTNGNFAQQEFAFKRVSQELDVTFRNQPYNKAESENLQIVFDVPTDPDIAEMKEFLGENSYHVKVKRDGEYTKVLFAYTSEFARSYAVEYILAKHVNDGVLALPVDFEIKGTADAMDFIKVDGSITRNCRDPFLLYENGTYYVYFTGWRVYKSASIDGPFTEVKGAVVKPDDYKANSWAPEVHKYNGKYYMFTTYSPQEVRNPYENHGCIIMEADNPEGPFKMITDGWITPSEWDCIDGTLYVDPDGQPWMVFVHEHTSLGGNGAFAAAKLSDDFTHFTSEPIELFRAKDAWWSYGGITDGCFMYTTENGELLMLWSNNDIEGYSLGVARSASGKLDGEWTHDEPMLFTYQNIGIDGGHGMIFTDVDGQMYACLHAPNDWGGNGSKMTLVPIVERNNTLVWDIEFDK